MSGSSVKLFYNKSTTYIPPHLQKKKHSDVDCKIVDFDISDAKEKNGEKLNQIQDIKSQVQEHQKVGSLHVQESEDETLDETSETLDEYSERREWPENSEKVMMLLQEHQEANYV